MRDGNLKSFQSSLWIATRNVYRRMQYACHARTDGQGVASILYYLQTMDSSPFYIKHTDTVFDYDVANPMVIFICHRDIIDNFAKFGKNVVGLDATFNITQYDVCLFAIMGRYDGGAIPICYFLSSSKSTLAVTYGLQFLKQALVDMCDPYIEPAAFIIDKDEAERNALNIVFPGMDNILVM